MNLLFKLSENKALYRLLLVLLVTDIILFQFYGLNFNLDLSKNALDLRLGYTAQDVINYFTLIGEDGRTDYKFAMSVIDVTFPIIYGLILIIVLTNVVKKQFNSNPFLLFIFVLIPIAVVILDLLENRNTLSMMASFPNITEEMAAKGSLFTLTKWSLGGLISLIIGYGIFKTLSNKKGK